MALNAQAIVLTESMYDTVTLAEEELNYAMYKFGPLGAMAEANKALKERVAQMESKNKDFQKRLAAIERQITKAAVAAPVAAPVAPKKEEVEEEEDVDLFGSDDDDEAADAERERIKAERVAEYNARKAKKVALVAKSEIMMDVKPWDDETDMKELEKCVRSIECDGLLWGGSKLVEVGYGIKKLQIAAVVEDDKCGTDFLEEAILGFEDYVQSMDIVSFNKL